MVTIKKGNNGEYEVSIKASVTAIDKQTGYMIKKEVGKITANHRIININLKQIESIDKNGLSMLEQLVTHAEDKNCDISFSNYRPAISNTIQKLF